jgi:hypothetical protein
MASRLIMTVKIQTIVAQVGIQENINPAMIEIQGKQTPHVFLLNIFINKTERSILFIDSIF